VKPPIPSRALTTFAVGFLVLDAALLAWAGVGLHRPWLLAAAGACAGAGLLVIVAWRRYRRTLAELETARREMKREVEEIRELLRNR
jgi:hypothetical protein